MPIPDYQTLMLPLLRLASDGQEHSLKESAAALAEQFNLTETEKTELLPSGRKAIFYDRVGWARTYLGQAKLLEAISKIVC